MSSSSPSFFTPHLIYEHALTKRARLLLRIDYLARQFEHHYTQTSPWGIRAAMSALIEFNILLEQHNIKSELIRELDQRLNWIRELRDVNGADPESLDQFISMYQELLKDTHTLKYPIQEEITKHALISSIAQRFHQPGSSSEIDIPAYQNWLLNPRVNHSVMLQQWFAPYESILETSRTLLGLIRDSASFYPSVAKCGSYKEALDPNHMHQMLRVRIRVESDVYPDITVSSQSFIIAFRNNEDVKNRPIQTSEDVEFELSCCLF